MEGSRRHGRNRSLKWGPAVLIGMLVAGMVGPASAAPVEISSPVTGTLTVAGNDSALTGVVFDGTYDDVTGDLVGKLVFPASQIDVTTPVVATIATHISQPADGTGGIDLATNAATFTADLVLSLDSLTIPPAPATILTPCTYTMSLTLAGTFDPATQMLSLAQDPFSIAANPADGAGRCAGLGALIDAQIVGANNAIDAVVDLSITDAAPPAPPVVPVAPPAPAPAAAPVAAAPQFTG